MFRALNTAASGMIAQQMNLDNIANNLANASTVGFRTRRLQFQDLLYQNVIMPGAASTQQTTYSAGLQVGLGARSSSSEMVQTQGDFESTGNQLDLAIQGTGFFQVQLPSGQLAYTRAGNFQVDAQGQLVTSSGYALQPAISIPNSATSVTIGTDGTVSVSLPVPAISPRKRHSTIPLRTCRPPGATRGGMVGLGIMLVTEMAISIPSWVG